MTDEQMAASQRLPDVWATRDYPVLREVVRLTDARSGGAVPLHDLASLGMDGADLARAVGALDQVGLIRGGGVRSSGGVMHWFTVERVSPRAYVLTGLHPDPDQAQRALVDALHAVAEQTDDEAERTRLQRAADAIGDLGKTVAGGVLTAYLTGMLGS